MNIPKDFDCNEFSFSNTSLLKLYDTLSVIDFSLKLIEEEGRHEFEPVIMQQLRMIFTKGNNYYESDTHEKRGLTKSENSFSLFEILGNINVSVSGNNIKPLKEQKIFPKIQFAVRDYEDRINSNSKYYLFSEKSIVESNKYTVEEFLKQPYIEVEDANGKKKYKNVEQCIKILANKLQGAHYQVHIKKVQLRVIQLASIIAQTLGEVTKRILMPICQQFLLEEDEKLKDNSYSKYFQKKDFISFNIHSATPIFDND